MFSKPDPPWWEWPFSFECLIGGRADRIVHLGRCPVLVAKA